MRCFIKQYYRPFALMALIFLLSSIPGEIKSPQFQFLTELKPQWQNLLHIPLFALLQFLWLQALVNEDMASIEAIVVCCLITLGYGLFDEWHQMFVVGRYASWLDVGLNAIGVLSGTLLYRLLKINKSG